MALPEFLDVDPRVLRLPPSSLAGADPSKLQRQIARHGRSTAGMPRLVAYRGTDGELIVYDGDTRATRGARLLPQTGPVEVIGDVRSPGARFPTSGSGCHDRSGAARGTASPGRVERGRAGGAAGPAHGQPVMPRAGAVERIDLGHGGRGVPGGGSRAPPA